LPSYRSGRVLFAGDAAHLVPIFGVRGLNSGLDDAGNLAWKLALVQQQNAEESLLDTYSSERVLAARENIAYGAKSTEFMAPPHRGFALMREAALRLALVAPGVRPLINPRQTTPVEYVGSALNRPDAASDFAGGPRAGTAAPEARLHSLQGPWHLTSTFGTRFVGLYFSDDPHWPAHLLRAAAIQRLSAAGLRLIRMATQGAPDERTMVDESGQAWRRYDATEGTLYLIRPDGYVMGRWRGEASLDLDRVLEEALKDRE
jgi:3-(3-hydroxy-phenyl)propionate hydroxylase